MLKNEEEELLTLVKDNNRMLKDIWKSLRMGTPNDDIKDFMVNVIANKLSQR